MGVMTIDLTSQTTRAGETLERYRRWGYLRADLDPLGRLAPTDLPPSEDAGQEDPDEAELGRRAYGGTLTVEMAHIPDPTRRRWLAERLESPPEGEPDRRWILAGLTHADTFETWLQSRYLGTKRFSIEGVTALIPFLHEALDAAIDREANQAVLAMSHRGRLNVMLNVVGRPPEELLAGFEDVDPRSVLGSGDVKYHMGATGLFERPEGSIRIHLASNPSHLEAVDPVVAGRVWAKQRRWDLEQGRDDGWTKIVPIVMHGDAAFAGQGILAETLNMASLPGFAVGGTVHVIVNNLIGFTTEPKALWSWRFTTDVAKRLPIPIFHVNGEDPEAVVRAARLAMDYRFTFGSDVVVDMIGYRRHGHSEIDDPTITQPLLYEKIQSHPRLYELYARSHGLESAAEDEVTRFTESLERGQETASQMTKKPSLAKAPAYWDDYFGGRYEAKLEVETGLDAGTVGRLTERLTTAPDDFHVHDKVARLLDQRAKMGRGELPIDYGFAENLAFASLVDSGVPVRLSGQDSRRATFAQRHAVLVDVEDATEYFPLQNISPDQAPFDVYDSMLSEAAVMGFEYGVSRDYPEALVLWEAQFGDFVNGAQIIIDQFISAGEDKWGLLSGLVLLLPHGYEGQGPEHSSARIERFLQLAAEDNVQVCQPSTAAQYFHLLRRQALRHWRKPLVVFTPKSMLRAKTASSPVEELARERFQNVMPEGELDSARRVLVATGKILHELRREREARGDRETAILGLEQMYPFPDDELLAELDRLGPLQEIVWVQEEPANMGALSFVVPRLERISRGRPVRTVKRAASASPATGSMKAHQMEQKTLLTLAFTTKRSG